MKINYITLCFALFILLGAGHIKAQDKEQSIYMFSYFKDNGADGLHLAFSNDGFNWQALNNDKSLLTPEVGGDKLMRDPCIIRGGDGMFHMVWTVSWKERSIGYSSSSDLLHWRTQQEIPVMAHEPTAQNCWAPEIFYDKDKKDYMIYWSTTIPGCFSETSELPGSKNNHRIYYVTTKDFKTYSKTKLLFDPGANVIDATIHKTDGQYVMFIKDETEFPSPKKDIHLVKSKKMNKGYSKLSSSITGNYWAEGPTAIKIDGKWIVYFDKYVEHKFGAISSSDLINWTDVSDQLTYPEGLRHGTVFSITKDEFEVLKRGIDTTILNHGIDQ